MKLSIFSYRFRFVLMSLCAVAFFSAGIAQSKETTTDLSKAAHKGLLTDTRFTESGSLNFTYGMRLNKKDENMSFEDYSFDKELNFKGMQASTVPKAVYPDKNVISLYAYAGGTNSFNVLSQKLTLQREEWVHEWNFRKQRYELGKRISKETVKVKNDEGKYLGYTAYSGDDGAFVIASYQPDKKGSDDQFVALLIDINLNIKATPITLEGDYSLIYCAQLESQNIFVIMAPHKNRPNTSEYVYAEFTPKADLVNRSVFTSPSANMVVMDHREINGSVFLCASSTKKKDAYNDIFPNYASISNPGAGFVGSSYGGMKYEKAVFKEEMDNFHFLKFTNGALAFATAVPVKSFKDKVVSPPSQKKSHSYQGKRLYINELKILPDGGYLMAGQLLDRDVVKDVLVTKYLDMVGFQFDAKGELRAQFAVEKMNDDTKSELWPSEQNFHISSDGKTAYWEILEVQGFKGYDSFADAYAGNKTYTFGYFPRVAKITLSSATVSDFEVMGNKGKFVMYKNHSNLTSADSKTRFYIGHDEDYEKLWVGKYNFD